MCTVTVWPRQNGYVLGMNRDEQRARVAALPPRTRRVNRRLVAGPSEPGGGMWIALNDAGATFALINWYSIGARVNRNVLSRGEVVLAVSASISPDETAAAHAKLPLERVNPFRLIGVFPGTRTISEWRWDLKRLVHKSHRWRPQQWISSGVDEPRAQRIRGRTFRIARGQRSAGTLKWLRRLHGSHTPECGPFSTCMHRDDAVTVSYTETTVLSRRATLRYRNGPPCAAGGFSSRRLEVDAQAC